MSIIIPGAAEESRYKAKRYLRGGSSLAQNDNE